MLDGVGICNSKSLKCLDNQGPTGTQQLEISEEINTNIHVHVHVLHTIVHVHVLHTIVHVHVLHVLIFLREIQSRRIPTLNRIQPKHLKI